MEVLMVTAAALLLYHTAYTEKSPATDRLLGFCLLSLGVIVLVSAALRLLWANAVEWRLRLLSRACHVASQQPEASDARDMSSDGRQSPFEVALAAASESVREERDERMNEKVAALVAAIGGSLPPPATDIVDLLSAIRSPELHPSRAASSVRQPSASTQADLSPQQAAHNNDSFPECLHPVSSSRQVSPQLSPKKLARRSKSTFRRNTRVAASASLEGGHHNHHQPDHGDGAHHHCLNDSSHSRGTVMVVKIRTFLRDDDAPSEAEVHAVAGCLGRLLILIEEHGGVVYRFDTHKIVATFHVQVPCPQHALLCVYATLEISKYLEEMSDTLTFGIGIAGGQFISGDVGTKDLRTFVVVGRSMQVADDVAELNFDLQTRVLLTDSVQDEVQTSTTTMLVDFVADERVRPFADASAPHHDDDGMPHRKPYCVFELRSDVATAEDLLSPKTPAHCRQLPHHVLVVYLEAFFMVRSGEFAKAAEHLALVPEHLSADPQLRRLQRLARFCDAKAAAVGGALAVPSPYHRRKYHLWDDVELSSPAAAASPLSERGPSPSFTRRSRHLNESPTKIIEAVIRARSSTPGHLDQDLLTSQPSGFMNLSMNFVDVSGVAWRKSEHLLGKGNFGEVFLGLRPDDGKLVAMKQLKIPAVVTETRGRRSGKKAQDELEALVSEITLLCQLRHPNIVFFLGCAVVSHDIIINLEYISGGSLQSMLRYFGSLPFTTVQRYVKDVLRGLQFLHSKEIIHLDLKPANVLLHVDGSCKVTDFGTSIQMHKIIDSNLVVGTPLYMSPEQARGVKHCSFQSDLWCLGLTVIEMLCGELPFDTDVNPFVHMRRLAADESYTVAIPAELPAAAHSFVAQCLQRDPAKRGSCDELLMHSFLFSAHASNTPMRHSKSHADTSLPSRKSSASVLGGSTASGSASFPPKVDAALSLSIRNEESP